MRLRTLKLRAIPIVAVALAGLALDGCGQGGSLGSPRLPLLPGSTVVAKSRRCDRGNNVYCDLYLAVVDPNYRGSQALMSAQRRRFEKLNWSVGAADIGQEQTAVSPDHSYRVTYATDEGELRAIDLGWVQRPSAVSEALGRAMFQDTPALAIIIGAGPS